MTIFARDTICYFSAGIIFGACGKPAQTLGDLQLISSLALEGAWNWGQELSKSTKGATFANL